MEDHYQGILSNLAARTQEQ